MPLGRRNIRRVPLPRLLVAAIVQTEKICESLRYFSMIPLQLSRPKPCSSRIGLVSKRCSLISVMLYFAIMVSFLRI